MSNFSSFVKKNDVDFEKQVNNAIEKCRNDINAIPSLAQIRAESKYKESRKIAYYYYLIEIRKNLIDHFSNLDEKLQESLERTKSEIAQVLAIQGKLSELAPSQDGVDFLEAITKECARLEGSANDLNKAFNDLLKYVVLDNLSIRNKLRGHLDKLDPDITSDPFSQQTTAHQAINFCLENFNEMDSGLSDKINAFVTPEETIKLIASMMISLFFKKALSGEIGAASDNIDHRSDLSSEEQIQISLKALRNRVIENCERTLQGMGNEPNRLAYTMIREFTEKVTRQSVEAQWEKLLMKNRSKIWDEFKSLEEREKARQNWLDLVEQTKVLVVQVSSFQILTELK